MNINVTWCVVRPSSDFTHKFRSFHLRSSPSDNNNSTSSPPLQHAVIDHHSIRARTTSSPYHPPPHALRHHRPGVAAGGEDHFSHAGRSSASQHRVRLTHQNHQHSHPLHDDQSKLHHLDLMASNYSKQPPSLVAGGRSMSTRIPSDVQHPQSLHITELH